MLLLTFVLAATSVTATADDRLHPFYPGSTRAHSSLSPGSPKWFVPGYGYRTPTVFLAPPITTTYRLPYQPAFQTRAFPLLSAEADRPLPYANERIQRQNGANPASNWHYRSMNRIGHPWYIPGDNFRVNNPAQEFGQLR